MGIISKFKVILKKRCKIKDEAYLHSFLPHFFCSAFNSTTLFSALKVMKRGFVLRNKINAIESSNSWPPSPKDFTPKTYKLPKMTEHFFKNILTGSLNTENSPRVSWLTLSFAQYIIYAVSCRKIKTPKCLRFCHTQSKHHQITLPCKFEM